MKDPAAQWRPAAGGPTHNHLHAETRPRRFIPHANGSVNIQLGISPVPEEEGGGVGRSVGRETEAAIDSSSAPISVDKPATPYIHHRLTG